MKRSAFSCPAITKSASGINFPEDFKSFAYSFSALSVFPVAHSSIRIAFKVQLSYANILYIFIQIAFIFLYLNFHLIKVFLLCVSSTSVRSLARSTYFRSMNYSLVILYCCCCCWWRRCCSIASYPMSFSFFWLYGCARVFVRRIPINYLNVLF